MTGRPDVNEAVRLLYQVRLDAEMWFGAEALSWSHEQRCEALAELYDGLWQDRGGEGPHPWSARLRAAS